MTNYTKTTDFAAKDALPSGNSAKIVKGSEIDTEFNNIATASATKANANDAALTGTTTFETISDGTIAITAFVDEDNMASDSATLVPTQQSVKAYVDSQVTAQDLDFQADSGGALSIDLDSETLTFTGGTGIDTSGALNAVTFAIDSTVATLTGSQTLSNKTLATPVVSGNLTTDGLIDGRDVATDGTKLDGIESGATADQTAAEIKTAYESNANTNAFTDADESKLDGIEALADVTDTTNVTAAGALMDSELTSEASVKALNQGVATTDSPTFAGLTTTADVSFGDNDKAIFGAGSDLEIFHDGSHSYVRDSGTGHLKLQGTDVRIQSADGAENFLVADLDGAVKLYNNDAQKFQTTSTGIDVTGTAVTDGVTINSGNTLKLNAASTTDFFTIIQGGTQAVLTADSPDGAANMLFKTTSAGTDTNRMLIAAGGDISFYEDTGTTPKFFWDASAERLAIGSSSPAATLDVVRTGAGIQDTLQLRNAQTLAAGVGSSLGFGDSGGARLAYIAGAATGANNDNGYLSFYTRASDSLAERLRIDSSGNLIVGGTTAQGASAVTLTPGGSIVTDGFVKPHTDASYDLGASSQRWQDLYLSGDVYATNIKGQNDANTKIEFLGSDVTRFVQGGSEKARLDASGNLLVGTTDTDPSNNGSNTSADDGVAITDGEIRLSKYQASANVGAVAYVNRTGTDGDILRLRKSGSTVGSIGAVSGQTFIDLKPGSGGAGFRGGNAKIVPYVNSADADDTVDIGATSVRFKDIYATNGTIQTSDRNEKQDIEALSDAEQRVAVAAKGLLRKFRWISSVEENGDEARIHFGIIAQDLQAAFEAEGLDAGRYGMFINTTWTDEETGEERSRMGVRYSELLAFIIAAI